MLPSGDPASLTPWHPKRPICDLAGGMSWCQWLISKIKPHMKFKLALGICAALLCVPSTPSRRLHPFRIKDLWNILLARAMGRWPFYNFSDTLSLSLSPQRPRVSTPIISFSSRTLAAMLRFQPCGAESWLHCTRCSWPWTVWVDRKGIISRSLAQTFLVGCKVTQIEGVQATASCLLPLVDAMRAHRSAKHRALGG